MTMVLLIYAAGINRAQVFFWRVEYDTPREGFSSRNFQINFHQTQSKPNQAIEYSYLGRT